MSSGLLPTAATMVPDLEPTILLPIPPSSPAAGIAMEASPCSVDHHQIEA